MARTRSCIIRESVEELETLRMHYMHNPASRALLLIRYLAEDKSRTIAKAALKAGIAKRTAERIWRVYRERGISGIIENQSKVGDIRKQPAQRPPDGKLLDVHDLVVFMNEAALISRNNQDEWVASFKMILGRLIKDADRIVVHLRRFILPKSKTISTCRLTSLSQSMVDGEIVSSAFHDSVTFDDKEKLLSRILSGAKPAGIVLDDYHEEVVCSHHYNMWPLENEFGEAHARGSQYIGSVLLFRQKTKQPISESTRSLLQTLNPFLSFLFTLINVNHATHNGYRMRMHARMSDLDSLYGLTRREIDVYLLLIEGYSVKQIAEMFTISSSTVSSHLGSIYKKVGVKGRAELVAFMSAPRSF